MQRQETRKDRISLNEMANPQKENGYTAIANEIFEALARIRIPGEARQILDVVLRKTYGFNKKKDAIALSQFCVATGLKKPTVCKALNKLKEMNLIIITQKDNRTANVIRFNKDFDTWELLPKKVTLPKKIMSITQKDNASLPKKVHTKDTTTKDTTTKDISNEVAESKVNLNPLIEKFKAVNPTYEQIYKNKTQRAALERLVKKFGVDEMIRVIEVLPVVITRKYAPRITTPLQLESKFGDLIAFTKQEKSSNNQGIGIAL